MTSSIWRPSRSHSGALDRFTGQPQARRWLVEGVFPQAQAALVAAAGGVGKSFFAAGIGARGRSL